MTEIRKKRIESLLRDRISLLLARGEVKDPRISGIVTISEVSITKDLKDAKVYVSIMGDADMQRKTVEVFQHAAGHIQKLLGRQISLKSTPRLAFHLDSALDHGFRIDQTLKGIAD